MSKRMALGKGLGALIPDAERGGGELFNFCIVEIFTNPKKPRKRVDDELIS